MDSRNEPLWQWPSESAAPPQSDETQEESTDRPPPGDSSGDTLHEIRQRHYSPRTCRICLETVYPTFPPPSEYIPGFLQPQQRVVYESSDPESGRLLRPCKCKGSSRYVHEGCLQLWRHSDPGYGKRNYWHCPTCGFYYRLERLRWARWISSTVMQLALTLAILLFTVFLLGFVADPIFNIFVDPVDPIVPPEIWDVRPVKPMVHITDDRKSSWTEHYLKGVASLGLLSCIKSVFAFSPWHGLTLRPSRFLSGSSSGRNTGRNRVGWLIIVIGVGTFLWAVYKGVRTWSCKVLETAGERVMDVPLPDDEDEAVPMSTSHQSKKDE
ncbi:RING finger domain protein [Aspergillus saccharolyticus JOP 1030-1]|uniref:RING finger domain protein n=1 Tax=Aspergillus saccharolyticus JOP 1030-1 TaxID=1450539 RepID=A0A319AR68_9EURO|nr:RING finger domain protein [Aspergillus saccharolyticus JOP 1030-1]PYH48882.1 RING finger domain protein [Aspergillus saccharolyticus JOP 1030-1]